MKMGWRSRRLGSLTGSFGRCWGPFEHFPKRHLIRGDWTDPRLSKTNLAEWSERRLVTKTHLKPKTLAGYRSNLHAHVLPAFGNHQLRHIDRMAAEEWIANLQASGLGPSGVRQGRQVLNAMLTLAVDAGYLPAKPVDGTSTPRSSETEMLFLDADEVERLAERCHGCASERSGLMSYSANPCEKAS